MQILARLENGALNHILEKCNKIQNKTSRMWVIFQGLLFSRCVIEFGLFPLECILLSIVIRLVEEKIE